VAGVPTLDAVARALSSGGPRVLPSPTSVRDRASVALVFAGDDHDLRLCFIRRVARDGDPWSGHMAFPGGRACEDDPSTRACAEREAFEEVGLDLGRATFLGALDDVPMRRVVQSDAVLSSFDNPLPGTLPQLRPDAREVADAFWTPVVQLWDPGNRTVVPWEYEGTPMRFPGITHGQDVIWGLTYRVLDNFAKRIGHPF
jgi:8-oxo-dGTP pyrophosphatase MutT (NUDIX family)